MPTAFALSAKSLETSDFFDAAKARSLFDRLPVLNGRLKQQKKQFAELEGIRDWKIHAALIELEPIDVEEEPDTPSILLKPHTSESERFPQQRP